MAKVSINLTTGSLQKEDIIVGIDLGTTNSLVAIIDEHTRKPLAIKQEGGDTIVPSVVYLGKGEQITVGKEALQYMISDPQQTIYSAKRLMGKSYKDLRDHQEFFSYKIVDDESEGLVKVKAGDRFYSPIELSSLILKELKARAEHYLHTPVKRAVITVPAYFNDAQRQATRDAGKLAGLDVLRIVNEPTAAALAYGLGLQQGEEKLIAVYDLGGGTFDISILKIQDGIFEVLSTHGDTYLGGDDLDRALVQHWMNQLGIDNLQLQQDKSLVQELRLMAEQAKKALSDATYFESEVPLNRFGIKPAVSRETFETLIRPILERTLDSCKAALKDAGIDATAVQEVVMVGGSTRVPLVKQLVKTFFQKEKLHDELNPDEVVALGAAVEADILSGNRTDLLLLDVTPLSLGIETLGGLMDVIIPRNSKIPSRVGRQYTTSVDGQVNLKINVYQGERDLVAENRKLATFDLKGIPAMPAGLPKVQVNFVINADGILTVSAEELRSGVKQEVAVKPQYGLTDEEVERMLLDSLTHASTDVATRMLIEAKTEAEQLFYVTDRFLEKNGTLLTAEEINQTRALMNRMKSSLEGQDKDQILSNMDELNEFTRPFAERLMDKAVAAALKGKTI